MIQLYFLSILLNAGSGALILGDAARKKSGSGDDSGFKSIEDELKFPFSGTTFRLVLGILTGITGILKLLSTIDGKMPVIGDIVPALAGMSAGFVLLFDFYKSNSTIKSDKVAEIDNIVGHNKKLFGIFAVASAVLHFLFPNALLL
jgi:hypothetical protein